MAADSVITATATATATATTTIMPPSRLDPDQTLRAATALLNKIHTDQAASRATKPSLLADADEPPSSDVPIWLILTTKKHITDHKRLKPAKILLPHPPFDPTSPTLRICLITADPQRQYKDLLAHPAFPAALRPTVSRVLGLAKLKAKYNSYETRRQLAAEHDLFLADDAIITYLPHLLGKPFYRSGAKRPIPVSLRGRRAHSLADSAAAKPARAEPTPAALASEISRALRCALVHLAPSTTTAVKVGTAALSPAALSENISAVVAPLVQKFVPQQWVNVRALHVKGPETAALPLWLAAELWGGEGEVLEGLAGPGGSAAGGGKRRERGLGGAGGVIEVPGPDGKVRRLEEPARGGRKRGGDGGGVAEGAKHARKKRRGDGGADDAGDEMARKAARKETLRSQKDAASKAVRGAGADMAAGETHAAGDGGQVVKKARMRAAELI